MNPPLIHTPSPVPHPNNDGTYLTRLEAIELAIRGGNTRETAAKFADIHPSTLSTWITRGETDHHTWTTKHPETPPPTDNPYLNLYLTVTRNEALHEMGLVADWRAGAKKDWRAAEKLLAKRHGGRWADAPPQVQVTGVDGRPVQVAAGVMSDQEALALVAELESRAAQRQALDVGEVVDGDGEREVSSPSVDEGGDK